MIAENIEHVKKAIAQKCLDVNRNPDGIKLIAVSKNFGIDKINEAYDLGLKEFGENRAQELDVKFGQIGNKVIWHFIGHLQKNKVKNVVRTADFIHSIDSLQLAEEVNKRAEKINKVQKILLEIKTSAEETKSGINKKEEIFNLVSFCSESENLNLVGLMTIAPFTEDEKLIRESFSYLWNLKNELNEKGFDNIKELSMGMTSDFEIAIEQGATMLRLGTAIFGERDYSKSWREK
jgi:PLP dependent protein